MLDEATCDESGAGRALGWRGLCRQGQQRVHCKLLNADGFSIPGGIETGKVDHDVASLRLRSVKTQTDTATGSRCAHARVRSALGPTSPEEIAVLHSAASGSQKTSISLPSRRTRPRSDCCQFPTVIPVIDLDQ